MAGQSPAFLRRPRPRGPGANLQGARSLPRGNVHHWSVALYEFGHSIQGIGGSGAEGALPDYGHSPPCSFQLGGRLGVPLPVPPKFLGPELLVRSRQAEISAPLMGMPEAPMNQDDDLVFADDKVGPPWQTRRMQAEADATAEEPPAQQELRLGVFPSDSAHHPGADFWLHDVSHECRISVTADEEDNTGS